MPDFEIVPLLDAEGTFTTYEEAFPGLGRRGPWVLPFRAFLVRSRSGAALVDTGVGPTGGTWLPDRQGRLLAELAAQRLRPEAIRLVFLTHLHVDHVGWCGSFPAARYVVHRDDWDHFAALGESYMESVLSPLRARGALQLLDAATELAPGLRALPAPGHTPGHMCLRVGTGALIIGDLCVDEAQLADPGLAYAADVDPDGAAASRREVLSLAAEERLVVGAGHLEPALGTVSRRGEGFAWHPSN